MKQSVFRSGPALSPTPHIGKGFHSFWVDGQKEVTGGYQTLGGHLAGTWRALGVLETVTQIWLHVLRTPFDAERERVLKKTSMASCIISCACSLEMACLQNSKAKFVS